MTPLESLTKIITMQGESMLFKNQAIMYQILVLFSGNKLNPVYGVTTTDELIQDIKMYLHNRYTNLDVSDYEDMHRCVCSNVIGFPSSMNFHAKEGNISYFTSVDMTNIKANINKIIKGKRNLTHTWISEWKKNHNHIEGMLYRIFWLLQYYCVYYGNKDDIVRNKNANSSLDCTEYFSFSMNKKRALLNDLKQECMSYSYTLQHLVVESFDFYSFARIILDILVAQMDYYNHTEDCHIPTLVMTNTRDSVANDKQLEEFRKFILCYSRKTINYYNMLERYAPTNYYAATELGNLYFYGEEFLCGDKNNNYVLDSDPKKALQYFLMAVNNSAPPYPVACWWIGHIIKDGFCPGNEDIQKAKYYFELAKDYVPTYNSLAQLELKEADVLYKGYLEGRENYSFDQIVNKYVKGIELAGKAADNNWLFANNVIARFIDIHKKDEKLFSAIKEKVKLSVPFEEEAQLLCSCKYDNPWALHELSLYYIKTEQKEKAFPLLKRAQDLNYNRAFYTLAMHYMTGKEKEAMLKQASTLLYPPASYELAQMYASLKQCDRARLYLLRAEQQNLALRKVNVELQDKILNLKKILF